MKTREDILRELARTRGEVAACTAAVRHELDFVAKANTIVRQRPLAWLGGAAALGWFLAGPKTKTRVVTKVARHPGERPRVVRKSGGGRNFPGLIVALVRLVLPVLKPALTAWATRWLSDFVARTTHAK